MTQQFTTRYRSTMAAGQMYSPGQERETESLCLPIAAQQLTLTWAGADPSAAGDYTITIPAPWGANVTFTYTTAGQALALEGPALAAAWNADPVFGKLYVASAVGAVVTIVATSQSLSIPAASFAIVVPGATTLTAAQTVANGGASLRMGVLYRFSTATVTGPGITNTFREARAAMALGAGTVLADIRGMVAREANSTELSPTFVETNPDQYTAPDIFPGLLRGEGAFIVDPASATLNTATAAIYAVITGGTGTIPGALTSQAAGNVLVSGASNLIRIVTAEEQQIFGAPLQRMVRAKINRGL